MNVDLIDFGRRLSSLRTERGLSQEKLAQELGYSKSAISFYELGKRTADIEFLAAVAKYFNVSYDYLLGKSESKTTNVELKGIYDYIGLSDEAVENIKNICIDSQGSSSKKIFNYLCEANVISNIACCITNSFLFQAVLLSSARLYKLSKEDFDETRLKQLKEYKKYQDGWETELNIIAKKVGKEVLKHFYLEPEKIDEVEYKELTAIIEELTDTVPLLHVDFSQFFDDI